MADRLDNPLEKRRGFFRRPGSGGGDGFGRFAEATARFMGSPRFVLYMTIFVVAWIAANLVLAGVSVKFAWDPYPFILLNLAFSTQARTRPRLIMLAQNRQDARDRVVAEQDRLARRTQPRRHRVPGPRDRRPAPGPPGRRHARLRALRTARYARGPASRDRRRRHQGLGHRHGRSPGHGGTFSGRLTAPLEDGHTGQ